MQIILGKKDLQNKLLRNIKDFSFEQKLLGIFNRDIEFYLELSENTVIDCLTIEKAIFKLLSREEAALHRSTLEDPKTRHYNNISILKDSLQMLSEYTAYNFSLRGKQAIQRVRQLNEQSNLNSSEVSEALGLLNQINEALQPIGDKIVPKYTLTLLSNFIDKIINRENKAKNNSIGLFNSKGRHSENLAQLYMIQNTVKAWISVLEASYIIMELRPHHQHFRKRLTKSRKLYFQDVGFASYLLGIYKPEHVMSHPMRGLLFENFIVNEFIKNRYNQVKR